MYGNCPMCGGPCGPGWGQGMMGPGMMGPMSQGYGGFYGGPGMGGIGPWYGGGMGPWYTGAYGTATLPTDTDIETMVYNNIDADPLIPWDADITVEVNAGEVRLTGTVPSKRAKHAAGDDAWWVPGVVDVHNEAKIQKKERPGGGKEGEGEEEEG